MFLPLFKKRGLQLIVAVNVLWLLLLVVGLFVSLSSLRKALVYYLIGSLVFPVLHVGSISLRFELVYSIWLLLILLIKTHRKRLAVTVAAGIVPYFLYVFYITLVTFGSFLNMGDNSLAYVLPSLYGYVRPLLVVIIFYNVVMDDEIVVRILNSLILTSIPLSILSICQSLGVSLATNITLSAYTSTGRTPNTALLETVGFLIRSSGTFESPVYNGLFWLCIISLEGVYLAKSKNIPRRLPKLIVYVSLAFSILAGFSTLTATFFGGFMVVVALLMILAWINKSLTFMRSVFLVAVIAIIIWFTALPVFSQNNLFAGTLQYELNRLLHGTLLNTRYNADTGIAVGMWNAFLSRPLFGYGLLKNFSEVFVGDSLYLVVLYTGGVIGFSLFFWQVYSNLIINVAARRQAKLSGTVATVGLLWTILFLVVGIGQDSFFTPRVEELYWAFLGTVLGSTYKYRGG